MYCDVHYVANAEDQAEFCAELRRQGIHFLPERPSGPSGGQLAAQNEVRRRLLSLKPLEQVAISDTDPYPHYSPASQPLIQLKLPKLIGTVLISGHLRHHAYTSSRGSEFVQIDEAFTKIKSWIKANWEAIDQLVFIGPAAARLIKEKGYTWSPFDREPRVETIRSDGSSGEIPFIRWKEGDGE